VNELLPDVFFLAHLAATLCMTGVIWFVQVVHYPLFAVNSSAGYVDYQRRHMARTTRVVGPLMLVEAATAILLFGFRPAGVATWRLSLGLGLLVAIWLSTAFLQVPCHARLSRAFDPAAHRRLVLTNWIRTAGWTLRSSLVLWMAWELIAAGRTFLEGADLPL
jgi:hypothetical protein